MDLYCPPRVEYINSFNTFSMQALDFNLVKINHVLPDVNLHLKAAESSVFLSSL